MVGRDVDFMKGRNTKGHILLTALLILSLSFAIPIFTSRARSKKVAIVFTGGLGKFFHPLGKDPAKSKVQNRLDKILRKLKASYPKALFVDTGDFLEIPDSVETCYRAPAMALFRRHKFHVANFGGKEIFLGGRVGLFNRPHEKDEPFFVTTLVDAKNRKPLAAPFVDLNPNANVMLRFMGTTSLNKVNAAPLLKKQAAEPDRRNLLRLLLEKSPTPDASILLSDLSPTQNSKLAEDLPSLNLIIESHIAPGDAIGKQEETYIIHRTEAESVALITFQISPAGEIRKLKFRSYPFNKSGGFLPFLKKKKPVPPLPPLPHLGKLITTERFFKKLTIPYDTYEIRRVNASAFARELKDSQVYYYNLYKGQRLIGRAFFVDHYLGWGRPEYMFFTTLTPENRLEKVDFIIHPVVAGWDVNFPEILKTYKGKKWEEIHFDPVACSGAMGEFKALYNDVYLVLKIADLLIERPE